MACHGAFLSTHGTSGLNILALLTACPPGGRVLVNRDAHSSVTAAMVHGGFQPVYLPPVYDRELGVSLGPTRAAVHDLLAREHVDCVFLTSPNYYGIVGELAAIIALAHERGLPIVVDAAHAPHFHFSAALPTAAEDAGADFVTQSTHKVATALSQGSVLLLRNRKSVPHLYEHINELGLVSTSFSYPILASIELGVLQLVEQGDALWRETIARADAFRLTCRQLPGVSCFGREQDFKAGFAEIDRSRVTIDVSHTGLTGFEVERRLQAQHIYPELATLQNVLFLFTPGTSERDTTALYAALKAIVADRDRRRRGLPCPTLRRFRRSRCCRASRSLPQVGRTGQGRGRSRVGRNDCDLPAGRSHRRGRRDRHERHRRISPVHAEPRRHDQGRLGPGPADLQSALTSRHHAATRQ